MSSSRARSWVRGVCGRPVAREAQVQALWSGYGSLDRLTLDDGQTVILKEVRPPLAPRGDRGHARKLESYAVEAHWYTAVAAGLSGAPRMARCLGSADDRAGRLLLLEDLDAAGFPRRARPLGRAALWAALGWLAALHAATLAHPTDGLWARGTYWHLDTRPDELRRMAAGPLKDAAGALDAALSAASHRCLVHGDAKPANLCLSEDGAAVAAVDFQYVGGGVGVQDVAYLLGCMGERWCARHAETALDHYFACLHARLGPGSAPVEAEWRPLFAVAWADFARFLGGWAPGMGGGAFTDAQVRAALAAVR